MTRGAGGGSDLGDDGHGSDLIADPADPTGPTDSADARMPPDTRMPADPRMPAGTRNAAGTRAATPGIRAGVKSGPWTTGAPLAALRGLLDRPLASYYLLLASVGLLVMIGLVMVFSATSVEAYQRSGNPFAAVVKQLIWAAVGLLAFWFCQRLPVRTYRGIARLALGACLALMVTLDLLVFISELHTPPGHEVVPVRLGPIYAQDLWLYLGPVQLQPSELAKLGLALWGAEVLVRKGNRIADWRQLATPLFPTSVLLFLLVGYNDFGTMVCLFLLFIGLLWASGVRLRVFVAMFGISAVGMAALVLSHGYRLARLATFLDPSHADPSGPAYQFFQGLYAIANGGWFGVGLGQGHLKWGRLPNGHNDFIFAVIAEELGVVGCFVVLAVFGVFAYTGLRIARRVDDPYRRLVSAGLVAWLVGQATINIGGVTGLLPITGLPLPFISDGGTALVVALAAAGILTSFARAEPDASRALHARPPRAWVQLVWAPLPPLPRTGRASGRRSGPGARNPVGVRTAPGVRGRGGTGVRTPGKQGGEPGKQGQGRNS
jgi:cell division protein FtsW